MEDGQRDELLVEVQSREAARDRINLPPEGCTSLTLSWGQDKASR